MPQSRTALGAILSNIQPEPDETQPSKPVNKAKHPDYMKLSAYVPKELDQLLKIQMASEGLKDQSAYLEQILREGLEQRRRARETKLGRTTAL